MTQDLGTAEQRFAEYSLDEHIYVVGNEQNYHFQVLKLILGKLGFDWADSIYHLSYGMVELPEGKMKSREGTVVDADDLIAGMYNTAKETSLELGKINNLSALSYSNYVYYAIKIPKKNGGSVSLGVSYGDFDGGGGTDFDVDGDGVADGNTAHFKIYVPVRVNGDIQYTDGVMQTVLPDDTPKIEAIVSIEIENAETFITYSLAFSELAPDAYTDTAALDALFEEELDDEAKSPEKKEHQMNALADDGSPETSSYNFDTSALDEDFYYVYIKFTPNIDLYKHFIDVLWDSMPFYLAYEVKVRLEVIP
jgi:hypothetical protein